MKDFDIHIHGSEWEVFETFNGGDVTDINHAVLVKLKDPLALARSQGSIASAAAAAAPSMISAKVYTEFAKQLVDSLKAKGIDADTTVVEPKNFAPASGSHVAQDIGFAIGGAGILAALWYLFSGRKHK